MDLAVAPLPPVSDLSSHLGFWLRVLSNHVSQTFAARVAASGVTVAEWVMLRTLYDRQPMPPSRVAEEMAMTRGAITKLADRLIAKGLLLRQASPDDGRAQTLALSRAGTALVPELAALADRNDAEFFGKLAAGDRRKLEDLLRQLVRTAGVKDMATD